MVVSLFSLKRTIEPPITKPCGHSVTYTDDYPYVPIGWTQVEYRTSTKDRVIARKKTPQDI